MATVIPRETPAENQLLQQSKPKIQGMPDTRQSGTPQRKFGWNLRIESNGESVKWVVPK